MKKMLLLAAFVTGFSFLTKAGTGAETGTVQGTIIDAETKKPVANTIFSAAINKASFQKEFQTDAYGNFKVNVPVGEHTLIIDKLGYKAVKKENIIVREGVIIKMNLEVTEAEEEFQHPFMTPITIHSF
ncbi:MAG: carboxypeptidase-like regulatory domain-containing protein [Chitinophagaceae bacterium]|nr:carboxypeptidase-like regulatory domain-containing protein [Chitinophagaceae bacterium]